MLRRVQERDAVDGRIGMSTSEKITVLNPMGFAPKVVKKPLAPRLSTLDGKTVYLAACRLDDSAVFLTQMQAPLGAPMPAPRPALTPTSPVPPPAHPPPSAPPTARPPPPT